MISKGERTELRSIVRQQFKVLRSELEQREREMYAGVEEEIATRYAEADQGWVALTHKIHEITLDANRQVNDALYEAGFQTKSGTERMWFQTPGPRQPTEDRTELRRLATTKIQAQMKAAKLRLDREEADLLRNLAVGAIESDEAREFLAAIPTVGELVPVARLAELEAQITGEDA